MKTDLTTSIIAAIIGVAAAFAVTGMFIPAIEEVTIKTLGDFNPSLTDPDAEVFNTSAINPTVEVYVGQCTRYNGSGVCIDNIVDIDENGNPTTESEEESEEEPEEDIVETEEEEVEEEGADDGASD